MKAENKSYYKRLAIIGGVIGVILITMIVLTIPKAGQPKPLDSVGKATVAVEESSAELIKAALNVYYLEHSGYPIIIDRLVESGSNSTEIKTAIDNLPGFDYSVKGDRSSYRIEYKSITGEMVTKEGSYEEDYH